MNLISTLANAAKALLGVQKVASSQVAGSLLGILTRQAVQWNVSGRPDLKAAIDETFALADAQLGLDGPDIIRDLPPDAEERLFDGLLMAGKELAYWAAGLYGPKPTLAEVQSVFTAFKVSVPDNLAPTLPDNVPAAAPADPKADAANLEALAQRPELGPIMAKVRANHVTPTAVTSAQHIADLELALYGLWQALYVNQ